MGEDLGESGKSSRRSGSGDVAKLGGVAMATVVWLLDDVKIG